MTAKIAGIGLLLMSLLVGAGHAAARGAADSTIIVSGAPPVVAWDTGDGSTGQVYVSVNNGPEDFFGEGPSGSVAAPWIAPSERYAFTLYAGRDHLRTLAAAVVEPAIARAPNVAAPAPPGAIDLALGVHAVPLGLLALALLVPRGRLAQGVGVAAVLWALVPVLTAVAPPLQQQPFPDSAEYADAANQLAHGNGYVTFVHGNGPEPPRYPPGFALALTPFAVFGSYPDNVEGAPKVFAALYVIVSAAAAWSIGGPAAAAVTAVVIGSSPFARVSATLVLSDALAACLSVPLVLLARTKSRRHALLAGALAGVITTIRLSAGLALPALLLAMRGRTRLALLAGAAPPLVALGLFQWRTFGSPFRTGYDYWLAGATNFSLAYATASPPFGDGPWIVADRRNGALMQWLCPCATGGPQATAPDVLLYPAVLLGLFWTFAPPLVSLIGLAYLWSRRGESSTRFT